MGEPSSFAADPDEPLAPWWREEPGDATALSFEFTSRGDRVSGSLRLPAGDGASVPLVLLQHAPSPGAPPLDGACRPWLDGGMAVASIDLPLHGARTSAKLTHKLLRAMDRGEAASPLEADLWVQFVRQGVADLRRALDVLAAHPLLAGHPRLDAARVAYAGLGVGATLGAVFCAHEPRVRAAALGLGGGGVGPPAVDPARHVGYIAPRPLLLVNAQRDEQVPRDRALALQAAAGEQGQVLWIDDASAPSRDAALTAMAHFLAEPLESRPA